MEQEIERVMQQTGMDRMHAYYHVKARELLRQRHDRGWTL